MNSEKLLEKLRRGNRNNVDFKDFVRLIKDLGLQHKRTKGSHQIFSRPDIPDLLDIQDRNGEAIPYQLGQLIDLIDKYRLELED